MVAHNYHSQGNKVVLMKPSIDTRFGENKIISRAVDGMEADVITPPDTNDFSDIEWKEIHYVLVDKAQFLSEQNVDVLRKFRKDVPVICT